MFHFESIGDNLFELKQKENWSQGIKHKSFPASECRDADKLKKKLQSQDAICG